MRSRGAGLRQDETSERRAGPPAALQPPVTDRPARRAGPYHVGRISTAADRKRGARPTPHHCNGAPRPAPPPRPGSPPLSPAASALTAPARASWPSSCKRHLSHGSRHRRTWLPESLATREASTLQETTCRAELTERASGSLTAKEKRPARRHLTSPAARRRAACPLAVPPARKAALNADWSLR